MTFFAFSVNILWLLAVSNALFLHILLLKCYAKIIWECLCLERLHKEEITTSNNKRNSFYVVVREDKKTVNECKKMIGMVATKTYKQFKEDCLSDEQN